jgi:hypothetical protein
VVCRSIQFGVPCRYSVFVGMTNLSLIDGWLECLEGKRLVNNQELPARARP